MDDDVQVTMSRKEWADVLIDLDAFALELGDGLFAGVTSELEPGSHQLIRELGYKGVKL